MADIGESRLVLKYHAQERYPRSFIFGSKATLGILDVCGLTSASTSPSPKLDCLNMLKRFSEISLPSSTRTAVTIKLPSVHDTYRPAAARSADKSVSDGDCLAGRITKVIDDDATALITAAGIGQ
ncbi:MAG: hypothetical protein QOI30_681, partial [Mycobacterium sp.]|nr:hypothetical protein [Mycobacterium sp.]